MFVELWINGKLTDYAQAATKQNRIIPGCANSESEETAAEMIKPKANNLKKDNAQREVKDSAAQPQSYVRIFLQTWKDCAFILLWFNVFFLDKHA